MALRIKVDAALSAAVRQLEQAVIEQERAVNRILGLVELLLEHQGPQSPSGMDPADRLRLEGIIEACAFQDLTGQRIRKVNGFLKHLAHELDIEIGPPPAPPPDDRPADSTGSGGLSQDEVDRLLGR